jgi:hypothetical protein
MAIQVWALGIQRVQTGCAVVLQSTQIIEKGYSSPIQRIASVPIPAMSDAF